MNSLNRKIEAAARRAAEAKKNRSTLSIDAFNEGDILQDGSKRDVPKAKEPFRGVVLLRGCKASGIRFLLSGSRNAMQ